MDATHSETTGLCKFIAFLPRSEFGAGGGSARSFDAPVVAGVDVFDEICGAEPRDAGAAVPSVPAARRMQACRGQGWTDQR
eukprot:2491987-Pyramimonas_sp.AAC.1